MASNDLIDTTEMYLKTIFELEEDGITPLRARIVDRLGHSGPTVSQTVGRMERDGLVMVRQDRRLELTDEGRKVAAEVMRKHRLAERLLVDVIGMDWAEAHEEACRWEHVMSANVEQRLSAMLDQPATDPYGNTVPGASPAVREEVSAEVALAVEGRRSGERGSSVVARLVRVGEPVQAWECALAVLDDLGVRPGDWVRIRDVGPEIEVAPIASPEAEGTHGALRLPQTLAGHLFIEPA